MYIASRSSPHIRTLTCTHTHHEAQYREGSEQLRNEPILRLNVLLLLKHRVPNVELLSLFLCLAGAKVGLDTLLKLWPGAFLLEQGEDYDYSLVHNMTQGLYLVKGEALEKARPEQKCTNTHRQDDNIINTHRGVLVAQYIPVKLKVELLTLPELKEEHSCTTSTYSEAWFIIPHQS